VIRLTVRCEAADAERVLAELVELVPGGVEEEHGEGWVEYSIYGPPGELPELPPLTADAGLLQITSTEIPDDWADNWRDFHKPVSVGDGRLVVQPSWIDAPADDPVGSGREAEQPTGSCVVTIDPGQAFGTGALATTSLCLELLLELADAGEASGPLVDLGTGSGVLAIAAAKLGWSPVLGIDSEVAALEAAAENARVNRVELELRRVNLRAEPPPAAPTVVANLTAPLLREVAGRLDSRPRALVCSGLLASEMDDVRSAFAAAGLEAVASRSHGDWAALGLRSVSDEPRG
jgi:ribosomal protein L11 methyltransferase